MTGERWAADVCNKSELLVFDVLKYCMYMYVCIEGIVTICIYPD